MNMKRRRKNKAGHMIMNKTQQNIHVMHPIKYLEKNYIFDCTINLKMVLLQSNSQQRDKLCRVPRTNFVTMVKVYNLF